MEALRFCVTDGKHFEQRSISKRMTSRWPYYIPARIFLKQHGPGLGSGLMGHLARLQMLRM